MTSKQEIRLRNSIAYWHARALTMDRIGDRKRNLKYTAKADALRAKLSLGLVGDRMAKLPSAAFVRQFRVLA